MTSYQLNDAPGAQDDPAQRQLWSTQRHGDRGPREVAVSSGHACVVTGQPDFLRALLEAARASRAEGASADGDELNGMSYDHGGRSGGPGSLTSSIHQGLSSSQQMATLVRSCAAEDSAGVGGNQ